MLQVGVKGEGRADEAESRAAGDWLATFALAGLVVIIAVEFFLSMPRLSVISSHIITVSTACDNVNVITCRLRLRSLVAEWPLCLETQLGAASIAVVTKYTITVFPLHTEKVLHSFANTPLRIQCKTISPSSLIPGDQRRHGDPSGHDSPALSTVF